MIDPRLLLRLALTVMFAVISIPAQQNTNPQFEITVVLRDNPRKVVPSASITLWWRDLQRRQGLQPFQPPSSDPDPHTDAKGKLWVPLLPPGFYMVKASKPLAGAAFLTGFTNEFEVNTNQSGSIRVEVERRSVARSEPRSLTVWARILLLPKLLGQLAPPREPAQGRTLAADGTGSFVLELPITDDSGLVVSSVQFVVMGPEQQLQTIASQASAGPHRLPLPAGSYTIEIRAAGYYPELLAIVMKPDGTVSLMSERGPRSAGDPVRLRSLSSSSPREGVAETSAYPMTWEATRRFIWTQTALVALPFAGFRSVDNVALLNPGVFPAPESRGVRGPGIAPGLGSSGQYAVNGIRSRENNFTVDGADNNDEDVGVRRQGYVSPFPQPLESISEFQVLTVLADSRYGRSIGAQVNALTLSGSKRWHGQALGFFTDRSLIAQDYFATKNSAFPAEVRQNLPLTGTGSLNGPPVRLLSGALPSQLTFQQGQAFLANPTAAATSFRRLQSGFNLGGPIARSGMSFFLSFENQRQDATIRRHFVTPTVQQRGIFETGDTGLRIAGVQGGEGQLVPAQVRGDAVFSLYPFPNNPFGPFGMNTYTANLPADASANLGSLKVDRSGRILRRDDSISIRLSLNSETSTAPATEDAISSTIRPVMHMQNLASFWNSRLSSSIANTFRYSFGRTTAHFDDVPDPRLLPSTLFRGTPFLLNNTLLLNQSGYSGSGAVYAPPNHALAASSDSASQSGNAFQVRRALQTTEESLGPIGQVRIAGFSPVGVNPSYFPQQRWHHTSQWADQVMIHRPRHDMIMGFDLRRVKLNSRFEKNARPMLEFNGLLRHTDESPLDLLNANGRLIDQTVLSGATLAAMGLPTGLYHTLSNRDQTDLRLRRTQVDFFFSDEIPVRTDLHVTFGFRMQWNRLPKDADDAIRNAYDLTKLVDTSQSAADQCYTASRGFFSCRDLVSALSAVLPASFEETFGSDTVGNDVRVGFAWNPDGRGRTVIRGGWGVYTGTFPAIVISESRSAFADYFPLNIAGAGTSNVGFGSSADFIPNFANWKYTLIPLSGAPLLSPGTLNRLVPQNPLVSLIATGLACHFEPTACTLPMLNLVQPAPRLKNSYSLQQALTLERALPGGYMISAGWVGMLGRKLLRVSTPNGGFSQSDISLERFDRFGPPAQGYPLRPYPLVAGFIYSNRQGLISQSLTLARKLFESTANSRYQSLQIDFRRRFVARLQGGASFTYSHAIDEVSDFFDMAGAYALPQDSARRSEGGSANFDVRLRATGYLIATTGSTSRRWWWRDWEFSTIWTAQPGQPFTVNSAIDVNRDGNLTDRLNTTSGLDTSTGNRAVRLFLPPQVNPMTLLAPDGQSGAIGRNTFRADGILNIDASLARTVPVSEFGAVTLRAELFNALNRASFGIPDRILESPGFGASYYTKSPARTLQFSGRFSF